MERHAKLFLTGVVVVGLDTPCLLVLFCSDKSRPLSALQLTNHVSLLDKKIREGEVRI